MNRTVWKNTIREIKTSLSRYLSIFAIAALGVAFFSGLTATAPDMRLSAENYFERLDLADFRLVSTLGFDDNDIKALEDMDFDKILYPAYFTDAFIQKEGSEDIVRVMSIPELGDNLPLNKLELISGRLPENENECVIDGKWMSSAKLGETVTLKSGDKNGNINDVLENEEYTVVGVCRSAMFIDDSTRGYTTIGNGAINYVLFIPADNFKYDVYTEVYISADSLRETQYYEQEYSIEFERLNGIVEEVAEERSQERYNEIIAQFEGLQGIFDLTSQVPKPEWYISGRDGFPGLDEYGENADRISNIAKIFPMFFLLVAALVCSTTISRMAEEQRVQIGLLKALGYGNGAIMFKFLFYAASAAMLGCLAGLLIGMKMFPYVIVTAYQTMYNFPDVVMPYNLSLTVISLIATWILISLVVAFSIRTSILEQPSQLMRPKAPAKGKRVLLERIGVIWRRIGFSGKVSLRNIFRYKRRMLMTVIGIAGCTALLLTGFALRDSVGDVVNLQYGRIAVHSGYTMLDSDTDEDARANIESVFDEYGCDVLYTYEKLFLCESKNETLELDVMVVESPEKLSEFFITRNRLDGEEYDLSDASTSAIITEKAAGLLGVEKGDNITVYKSDTVKAEVLVGGVAENYTGHTLYITEEAFLDMFSGSFSYNIVYFKESEPIGEAEQDGMKSRLLEEESVQATVLIKDVSGGFSDILNMLNSVIAVIIISAGILSFIVLYNLTNININERIREIATLKVLGFYDGEVDMYIFRENIILTFMGTGAGLFLGVYMSRFIIQTAEVNDVMFGRSVHLSSFVLAAVVTMVFSMVVSVFMHFYLKKVDMAESLKSVD